jgi:glycosyltransferase involved in cell wall biosynthesis
MGYGGLTDLVAAASRQHPNVHLLPPVAPDELGAWLTGADVGMAIYADTPNYRGGLPNKLFECLMAGVPVVASDFPPWRELLCADPDAPLGRVVDPDDLAMLAATIGDLIDEQRHSPAIRERCRRAAVARHNWDAEVEGLIARYRELGQADAGRGIRSPS